MHRAALFLQEETDGIVRCSLCPRRCAIPSGALGACGVRGNKNGKGIVPLYGHITALALDPIEKKPLFHFRPGSMILSAGFAGCNLRCPFCQNWHISQSATSGSAAASGKQMLPDDLVSAALHEDSSMIAYTYSEPLVHAEFLFDCMSLARRHGIANVLVTNGCANAEAAREILSLTDAANIDLKCFSADTYASVLGGAASVFETVLDFIRLACSMGVHVEVTTLVVPGLNDTATELDLCADFIASLGNVPWHLSAYHPDYHWNAPPTAPAFIKAIKKRAAPKCAFVYAGNIAGEENDTLCPHCGAALVRRRGYQTDISGLTTPADGENFYHCAGCGGKTPVSW
ncbi:MAG: AmmeMemoRadiSam system radical SAM enzyme [Treponema sp.]|jgi:pyruvate formate lyase activating enzyme|nr:AmmeMemoRadiSam system radical SAM enzyme [Treponema sp.]